MYRLGGAAVAQFQTACCIDVVLHAEAWLKVEVCLYKLAALVVVCVCYVSVGIDVVVRRAAKRRVHVEAQTCRDVQFVANLPVVVNPDVVVVRASHLLVVEEVEHPVARLNLLPHSLNADVNAVAVVRIP